MGKSLRILGFSPLGLHGCIWDGSLPIRESTTFERESPYCFSNLIWLLLQEKLDGYLQSMKGELEKQAKFNPDRFDDSLSKFTTLYVATFCAVIRMHSSNVA